MTYTNSSDDFDFEFLRDLPVPNTDDSEWVEDSEEDLSCQDCEYYSDNVILPCAVNPEKLYHAQECNDYSSGKTLKEVIDNQIFLFESERLPKLVIEIKE